MFNILNLSEWEYEWNVVIGQTKFFFYFDLSIYINF